MHVRTAVSGVRSSWAIVDSRSVRRRSRSSRTAAASSGRWPRSTTRWPRLVGTYVGGPAPGRGDADEAERWQLVEQAVARCRACRASRQRSANRSPRSAAVATGAEQARGPRPGSGRRRGDRAVIAAAYGASPDGARPEGADPHGARPAGARGDGAAGVASAAALRPTSQVVGAHARPAGDAAGATERQPDMEHGPPAIRLAGDAGERIGRLVGAWGPRVGVAAVGRGIATVDMSATVRRALNGRERG